MRRSEERSGEKEEVYMVKGQGIADSSNGDEEPNPVMERSSTADLPPSMTLRDASSQCHHRVNQQSSLAPNDNEFGSSMK